MLDFETAVKQEEERLFKETPKPEDVPTCTNLLDQFFLCYTVGSQMKSVYRHGHASECNYKFQDFKFCLSLKSMSPEDKHHAWIRRRAEWWARRRLARSSEDVWDIRTEPLANFPPPVSEMLTEQ